MILIPLFPMVYAALKDWAAKQHAAQGQTWANGLPYSAHLEAVEGVLTRFGYTDMSNPLHQVLRLSAWAHDLLEDTKVERITLRVLQGPDVEGLVYAVTNEPGVNRAERHLKTYHQIASTPHAVVLKLADRLSNVEASLENGPSRFLGMYRNEHPGFRAALYRAGGPEEPMWNLLDHLLEVETPTPGVRLPAPGVAVQRGLFD